ncbi:H(+)-transporting V0 sector ATPase subunit a [Entomophthora muscae]|uniref:H(+)-transporting V0 sector ATPase subunit a n=1 Tax=Entomophthora muscae TaxID=34485 RepID=A0ACC2TW21_9FUNG|nr:H(+)-transporting V0 sector ATPase subunit a [Entomophthora muscae]
MERKLRGFGNHITNGTIPMAPLPEFGLHTKVRSAQEIDELETSINTHELRLSELIASYEKLQRRNLELTELRHVLSETSRFFHNAPSRQDVSRSSFEDSAPLLNNDSEAQYDSSNARGANLNFVTGVISRSRMATFERILWRSLRGNLYLNFAEIDEPIIDPSTDKPLSKNAFIIFAHGNETIAKVRKISESLGATLYNIPDHPELRQQSLREVNGKIEDLNSVLYNTNHAKRAELIHIGENISVWNTVVKKEKAIYHTLNHFNYDNNRRCLIAEGWCASNDIDHVQAILRTSGDSESSLAPILHEIVTSRQPPTYHRTNKFTEGFQAIVDSYGVSNYGEVNPGLFTIISFPFLFAVMFGDLGHAIIMTSAALYMVLNERSLGKIKSEEFAMFYGGRYIILLMGLFSIFTGLIYNDVFSRSMTLFESGWVWPESHETKALVTATQVGVYPFGLDSAWHGSDNALIFTNSFKMKMSVIFGVIQMSFGVILTTFNYRHFNEQYSIYLEFIPQILFMLCIFGYLCFTIIYKWVIDWATRSNPPPSLLNMLIDMFLSPGNVQKENILFPGQAGLQLFLLMVALAAVPVMLFGKPMYLRHLHQQREAEGYSSLPIHSQGESNEMSHEEEFDFSELMIHQAIHTIEYCLNCISNTASYLRLWALSLAHAQLSTVLWDMILAKSFTIEGPYQFIAVFIAFFVWFCLTVAILILMEGLSAFLHALRLHWVEFNGKFYGGTGEKFTPFYFEAILQADENQ